LVVELVQKPAALHGVAGNAVVLVHTVLKTPNLKTRLSSAREEFRAVW